MSGPDPDPGGTAAQPPVAGPPGEAPEAPESTTAEPATGELPTIEVGGSVAAGPGAATSLHCHATQQTTAPRPLPAHCRRMCHLPRATLPAS